MEFIECESTLGHPRRMGFTYEDIEGAQRRLNGPMMGLPGVAGAERALHVRLWTADAEVISHLAFVGMRNFDVNMTREKAKEIIGASYAKNKSPFPFIEMLDKALKAGGFVAEETRSKEAEKQSQGEDPRDAPLTGSRETD